MTEPAVVVEITETPDVAVTVDEPEQTVTVPIESPPAVVEVSVPGPQGEPGETGEQGETGPPGPGDKYYEHTQNNPADEWGPISHNLGKLPSYGVVNSANDYLEAGIEHLDLNTAMLTFSAPESGKAYFN